MNQDKKKRSENWSTEEKDILRELIGQSRHIVEDKSTKASTNKKKNEEWKNIAKRLNELMGKNRSANDVKLAWKRMKLSAKENLSAHSRDVFKTGGGNKPKSPSQEDLAIMDIVPFDFVVEYNDFDSDAVRPVVESNSESNSKILPGPSRPIIIEPTHDSSNEGLTDPGTSNVNITSRITTQERTFSRKNNPKNKQFTLQQELLRSNSLFKEKHLEMSKLEHECKMEIYKLKIKKLNLEIEKLEKSEN